MTIWSICKRAEKIRTVKRKCRSGHIKAISNKNLSILKGLKTKFPQIFAPKLAEKFKKETKIGQVPETISNYLQ